MKTNMGGAVVALVVVALFAGGWAMWSGMQAEMAAATVQATVTGQSLTGPVMLAGEWVVKALISLVAGGTLAAFGAWIWHRTRAQFAAQPAQGWKSGPNARWQGARGPRGMSEGEMYRMLLMQQMVGQHPRGQAGTMRIVEDDDEQQTLTL